jgi:hypothetical protein
MKIQATSEILGTLGPCLGGGVSQDDLPQLRHQILLWV